MGCLRRRTCCVMRRLSVLPPIVPVSCCPVDAHGKWSYQFFDFDESTRNAQKQAWNGNRRYHRPHPEPVRQVVIPVISDPENPAKQSDRKIADVVAERIERLIVDGVLRSGQALPSERRLTDKLGVSRTALREGLKLLRARGIIETAHGKGSFVANLTAQPPQSPLMHLLASQPRTL